MNLVGEILRQHGRITAPQIDFALKLQEERNVPIGQILIQEGLITPVELDRAIAEQLGLEYVEQLDKDVQIVVNSRQEAEDSIARLVLRLSSTEWIAADLTEKKKKELERDLPPGGTLKMTSRFVVLYHLHVGLRDYLSEESVNALTKTYPAYSASQVMIGRQRIFLAGLLLVCAVWFFLQPWNFLLCLNILVTIFLVVSFGFKFLLIWKGSHYDVDNKIGRKEIDALSRRDLPLYSILVPMYKEPEVLPIIAKSLADLDYPKEKLDIKIVLEEDDLETQASARALNLGPNFEIIIVPKSLPKTKPKACNYALHFARGEFLTIYDAEDKPEPDQLLKAVAEFKRAPKNTAVIQARLNFFNASENWLTRMFTLEYSLWFDFYIPALERLDVPIPLGGTSNHFRKDILKLVGGWDPFNVTEDADLGIRFTQFGYRVGVVNSTTFEEANTQFGNWIRQRSRWLKGYMQTYLVHMRTPFKLWKKLGLKGFFSFQFFIGGTILTAFTTPVLYSVFAWWLIIRTELFDPMFIEPLLYLSLLNLLLGNAFFIYVLMVGVFKRKAFDLIPWAMTAPVYWLMLSLAAVKGLIQLITNPFYWEKTQHGISRFTKELIREAK